MSNCEEWPSSDGVGICCVSENAAVPSPLAQGVPSPQVALHAVHPAICSMAPITVPAGPAAAGGAGAGVGGAGFTGFAGGAGAGVLGAAPLFEAGAPLAAVLLVAEPEAAPEVVLPALGEAAEGAEAELAFALAATGDELELRPPQAMVASIKPAISSERERRNNLGFLNFRFGPSGGRAIWGALDGQRSRDHNRDQI